jgi:hypothetical protein
MRARFNWIFHPGLHLGRLRPGAALRQGHEGHPARHRGREIGHNNRADFDVNQTVELAYWSGGPKLTSVLLEDRRPAMPAAETLTTTVSTKGQVILPKAIRERRNWQPGTPACRGGYARRGVAESGAGFCADAAGGGRRNACLPRATEDARRDGRSHNDGSKAAPCSRSILMSSSGI